MFGDFETILNFEFDFSCLFWCFLFVVLLSIEDDVFLEKGGMLSVVLWLFLTLSS